MAGSHVIYQKQRLGNTAYNHCMAGSHVIYQKQRLGNTAYSTV